MAHKKTIRVSCYGPIALYPEYMSPWEDIWITYKVRRKKVHKGPCFIAGVDDEIEKENFFIEKLGHTDREILDDLLAIKKRFDAGEKYVIQNDDDMPNIYINCDGLTKKEVEKAIEWYLRKKDVLESIPRFRWNKPKFIAIPVL